MEVVCCSSKNRLKELSHVEIAKVHACRPSKNRFIAQSDQCGHNLSVRSHIQNSISLTIAVLPRII
jgi:hypothetical protein